MSLPYVGEIRIFAGNFAPDGWAFCDGQVVAISQNDALFALVGTTYGGDGRTTFALPDLRGRVPIHLGTGSGLSPRTIGEQSGSPSVTLAPTHLPAHTHPWTATNSAASSNSPAGKAPANALGDVYTTDFTARNMSPNAVSNFGGSQPHTNQQPSLGLNFIISLFGIFPTQT